MGARIRAYDWAATPLGPPTQWPQTLRTVVRLVLSSRQPMFVFWGTQHTCIYNDAYSVSLGSEMHPRALGATGQDAFAEIWDTIEPQISFVMSGQGATWHEDHLIPITRHGKLEKVYWTYGYSPIDEDASANRVGGVLVVSRETTAKVLNDIRKKFRLQIAERLLGLNDPHAVLTVAADLIGTQTDANWVGFVEIDSTGEHATTVFAWAAVGYQAVFGRYRLDTFGDAMVTALRAGHTVVIDDVMNNPLTATKAVQDVYRGIGRQSLISVPLMRSGRLSAVLTVSNADARTFSWDASDVAVVETVAERTWSAVERGRADAAVLEGERNFQAIVNAIDHLVWSTDAKGITDYYNERWYEFTGVPKGSTDGPRWVDVFHAEDREGAMNAWGHAVKTGGPYRIEYRMRHHSGQYRWVVGRAHPVRDDKGQITRWYGTCTDIHEVVEARELLRRSREELESLVAARTTDFMVASEQLRQSQKMEAIGHLTGGIAHDFNNNLAVVLGSLSLLRRKVGQDPIALGHVDSASESTRRASIVVKRLLAFSRQQPLAPENIDANKLVRGMSDLLLHTLGGHIIVTTSLADDIWPTHADYNQLENVILNLAVNARDAMPEGGTLTIASRNIDINANQAADHMSLAVGQYVMLSVTDTGTGMAPEVLARAFDPFFTTKEVGQGTGLGLSQVYGFMKQSGGYVNIASEVGSGTIVNVCLPRLMSAAHKLAAPPQVHAAMAGTQGTVVLVVDDIAAVRIFVVEALVELGYRTVEAGGGAEALRLLDTHPDINMLLTDIAMPDMDGRKLAEEARRRKSELKILLMSGYASGVLVRADMRAPDLEIISKPFTVEELGTKMNEILATTVIDEGGESTRGTGIREA